MKKAFIIIYSPKGKLTCKEIDFAKSNTKTLKVLNKKVLGKDKFQINLYDGRNIMDNGKQKIKVNDSIVTQKSLTFSDVYTS